MSEKDQKGPKLYAEKGIVVTACGEPIRTSEVVHVYHHVEYLHVSFRGKDHPRTIQCLDEEEAEETQRLIVESMLWGDGPETPKKAWSPTPADWKALDEWMNKHAFGAEPYGDAPRVPEGTPPETPKMPPYKCTYP